MAKNLEFTGFLAHSGHSYKARSQAEIVQIHQEIKRLTVPSFTLENTKMMNLNFTSFPTLSTQRLRLRQLTPDDAEIIFEIRSHPIVLQFLPHFKPKFLADIEQLLKELAEQLLKNNCIMWAITLKDKPNLIGTTCLWNISKREKKADIGYDLHPDFHRKGIMQEAMTAVLKYGFETVEFDTIEAMTHRENKASVQLLMKNNFEKVTATPHEMLAWPDDNQLFFLSKKRYK